jgi:hypothetical protein
MKTVSSRLAALMLAACWLVGGANTQDARAQDAAADGKAVTVSVFGDGELQIPAEFKRVEVQSGIIEHEFQAVVGDGKEGQTARVTMMAAGGDVPANIERWKGQFTGGDPKDQKTEEMKLGNWQTFIVDVTGNFAERMGGGPFAGGKVVNRENYAMTGAILVHPEGQKYFVKMVGPTEVVKANRDAFVNMIKSIAK